MKRITHYLVDRGTGKDTAISKQVKKNLKESVIVFADDRRMKYYRDNFGTSGLEEWQVMTAWNMNAFKLIEFLQHRGIKKIYFNDFLDNSIQNKSIIANFLTAVQNTNMEAILYSTPNLKIIEESLNVLMYQAFDKPQTSYNYARFVVRMNWKYLNVIEFLENGKLEIRQNILCPRQFNVINLSTIPYTIPIREAMDEEVKMKSKVKCFGYNLPSKPWM